LEVFMLRFLFPVLMLAGATTSAQTYAPQTVEEAVEGLLFGDSGAYSGNGWHIVMPSDDWTTSPRAFGVDDVGTAPRQALGSDDVEAVPFVAGEEIESVPRTVMVHEALQSYAVSLTTPAREFVVLSPAAAVDLAVGVNGSSSSRVLSTASGAYGTDDVVEISWWSENEPFYSCRKITVRAERRLHQSPANFAQEFRELVEQNMAWYPPNCSGPSSSSLVASGGIVMDFGKAAAIARGSLPWRELTAPGDEVTSLPITSSPAVPENEDTASISWQHDPDGAGPLEPVTVTASTERRNGESSSSMAKRLGRLAKELMEIFPPNVPTTPGGTGGGGSGSGG